MATCARQNQSNLNWQVDANHQPGLSLRVHSVLPVALLGLSCKALLAPWPAAASSEDQSAFEVPTPRLPSLEALNIEPENCVDIFSTSMFVKKCDGNKLGSQPMLKHDQIRMTMTRFHV